MDLGMWRWLMVMTACVAFAACSSTPTSPTNATAGPVISRGPLAGLIPQGPPPVPQRLAAPMPNAIGATRFLAFGDSITYGTLSSFDGSFLYDVPSHAYSERLKLGLDFYYPGQPSQPPRTHTVVNAGVPGEAARDGRTRIQSALTQHRPQALLLLEGINDFSNETTTPEEVVGYLSSIVNTARANNVTVLIATMPQTYESCHPDTGICRDNARDKIVPFNNLIRSAFSGRQNVHIVDLYPPFGTNHLYMGGDGLHPTEQGYALMASVFLARIEEIFGIRGSFQ